jgi:hypothetical protein
MRRTRRLAAGLAVLASLAVAASPAAASRNPTTAERAAIARAALGAGFPLRCLFVRVSTVAPAWSAVGNVAMQPVRKNDAWCTARGRVFDGVTFLRKREGRWRVVTAGSSVSPSECRLVPLRVRNDLPRFTAGLGC